MSISISLIESANQINQNILNSLLKQVESYMNGRINKLKIEIPQIVSTAISSSPEYSSLLGGRLKYEFGIPDSSSKLAGLINIWSNNIDIVYNKPTIAGNSIKSSFTISMIKIDFSDVLFTSYAEMRDELRGYSLPWLQWLLLEGNQVIIPSYEFIIGSNRASRTGNGIMRPSSASWKVPSFFSGTQTDNWITRALNSAEKDIQNVLDRNFKL
jgi:hypothetical protein